MVISILNCASWATLCEERKI